ncbi:MAG TPA: hypothetical protein VJR89_28500 [Polyangiales bacterium]|nr:hypothetical protein [Polyangiales bacterium]
MSSTSDAFRAVRTLGSFLLALWLSAPGQLAAQSGGAQDASRDASARALFEEGVGLVEHADWAQAEDRFRRALALRDSPVIAFNLASTLSERGKLLEASELLRKLQREPSLDAELRKSASDLQAQIAPRIARVHVSVENAAPGDSVQLDGAALLEAQLNVDIPIDPGSHELQLMRNATAIDTKIFQLQDGSSTQLQLRAPEGAGLSPAAAAAASPAAAPVAVSKPTPLAHDDKPITSQWWFWTSLGVIVASAAAVTIVVVSSSDAEPQRFQGNFDPASLAVEVKP